MLGDDLIEGTGKVIATVGHAARNAIKVGLIAGAVAGLAAVGFAVAGGGLAIGIAGAAEAFMAGASMWAPIGAAVAGATSLIPGSHEGFGLKDMFKKPANWERSAPESEMAGPSSQHTLQVRTHTSHVQHTTSGQGAPDYNPYAQQPPRHTYVDNSQHTNVYRTEAPAASVEAQPSYTERAAAPVQTTSVAAVDTPAANSSPYLAGSQENPLYQPGKGMELMRRGDEREASIAR